MRGGREHLTVLLCPHSLRNQDGKKKEYSPLFPKKPPRKQRSNQKDDAVSAEEGRMARLRKGPCLACGKNGPADIDHIHARGAGGKNGEFNIWPLCRRCHVERHQVGLLTFAERNVKCLNFLEQNQPEFLEQMRARRKPVSPLD
jgi:5-methylcytosine-specific restriction endonuclease McrA